jgi:hypothetical protein
MRASAALDSGPFEHHVWLTYRWPDPQEDGVWLRCRCGWKHHLGWLATPADAWFHEQDHYREVASRPPPTDVHHPKEANAT